MSDSPFAFDFENSYARELTGLYKPWQGDAAPDPRIVLFNKALAQELGLNTALNSPAGAAVLSGSVTLEGAEPLAQAYAGHQFGNFSPQLGDGRALLLGELIDYNGNRRDLHLKGSGPTPFSRGGDGKAALGPVLREYIVGEAMHALGIPTTRALAAVTTGEQIQREGTKPGAVLTRVASSHLRIGTFEYFARRGEIDKLQRLADYAIARHDPDLSDRDDRYLTFLDHVIDRQTDLVTRWMLVGFVHGVMNTDNTTISGETIDYGPCAFMDHYDEATVFSSIDRHGRYAWGNQPHILQWNLARLAETLLPLINPERPQNAVQPCTELIESVSERYRARWRAGMRQKIGFASEQPEDDTLIKDMLTAMAGQNVDYTQFFRKLAGATRNQDTGLLALFGNAKDIIDWLPRWVERLAEESRNTSDRVAAMNRANPIYVPRNHKVEEALQAAEAGDNTPVHQLLAAISDPFTQRDNLSDYETPAPDSFGTYVTYCGT